MDAKQIQFTYLISDGILYKIGKSKDPEKRLKQLKTANPYVELICFGSGVNEEYLHKLFFQKRKKGEWFDLNQDNLEKCVRLIKEGEKDFNRFTASGVTGTATWFNLTDSEIKRNIDAKKHSVDLNKVYIISFGKYKGTKIVDMLSQEQYDYCEWFLGQYVKELSKNAKKKDRKYKAFSWWVRIGYKEYIIK